MAKEETKRGRPRMLASEKMNIKYTIRLDNELDTRLQKRVKRDNSTVTEVIRTALNEYLDKE